MTLKEIEDAISYTVLNGGQLTYTMNYLWEMAKERERQTIPSPAIPRGRPQDCSGQI